VQQAYSPKADRVKKPQPAAGSPPVATLVDDHFVVRIEPDTLDELAPSGLADQHPVHLVVNFHRILPPDVTSPRNMPGMVLVEPAGIEDDERALPDPVS
jgi:hypothetical protein